MSLNEELKWVLPDLIRYIREVHLQMSQEKMAEVLRITTRGYQLIEEGKSLPSFVSLLYLNKIGVSIDELMEECSSELKKLGIDINEKKE
jgi:transcriptional regulator with XRE-family HTH domain